MIYVKFFIFIKKNVHPRKAFIIVWKRSFLYDNKNQIPERRSLSGIWFLFSIFTAFRHEAISCIFRDVTALPPEFQPPLIRAGAPFCVA